MIDVKQSLDFKIPTIEDAAWAVPMLLEADMKGCEYSFTTIFMWRKYYENQITRCQDHLFLQSNSAKPWFSLPVGGDLKDAIEQLMHHVHQEKQPLRLFVPGQQNVEKLQELFPDRFEVTPAPEDFDYIYRSEDLAELKGKKYHSKRNHIAGFSRRNEWQYESINDQNVDDIILMTEEWCRQKGNCMDAGLKSERCAIREALRNRKELSIIGGLIRVDNKVVAYTMGSPISKTVFDVHTEKALPDFPGAYAVINQAFVSNDLRAYEFINRENDLGIEGLRKAKQSYYPAIVLEKFRLIEKNVNFA